MGGIMAELLGSNIPGFVFSMLIPLLFLIFMLKDRQSKYILSYFCWGLFSVLFAFLLNEWVAGGAGATERITYNVAPIIEETLKALPLLLFFRNREFKPNLIIYCAMASGVGFSVQETLYYFTSFTSSPDAASLLPLIVRTVTTCLMHGMSTAVLGFGITITARLKAIRIPMVLGLLALSATIHSLFNILINTRLAIIALIMPAILYFLGLALLSDSEADESEPGELE